MICLMTDDLHDLCLILCLMSYDLTALSLTEYAFFLRLRVLIMFAISWLVSMHLSGFDASFSTHSCSVWGTSTPNDGLVYYQETSVNCLKCIVSLSLSWVGWINSLHESPSMHRLLLTQQRIRRRRGHAARSFTTTNILSKTLHAWFIAPMRVR